MVTTIHGQHPFVKPGYKALAKDCFRTPPRSTASRLVTVPWDSMVTPLLSDSPGDFDLAYNYSVIKIIPLRRSCTGHSSYTRAAGLRFIRPATQHTS